MKLYKNSPIIHIFKKFIYSIDDPYCRNCNESFITDGENVHCTKCNTFRTLTISEKYSWNTDNGIENYCKLCLNKVRVECNSNNNEYKYVCVQCKYEYID